jgi:hypothetical protein
MSSPEEPGRDRGLVSHAASRQPGDEPPTNAALRRVLALASEVVIAEAGGGGDGRDGAARFVVTGAEVAGLARLLAIVDGGTGDMCRCTGGLAFLLCDKAGGQVAQWTLHHQRNIRGIGNCDAELRDAPGATRWLADHGLTGPLRSERLFARLSREREARRAEWVAAAPQGLTGAAEAASRREEGAEGRLAGAVRREYPAGEGRIRALLAWAGFPARHESGTPWHEAAPERMLLQELPEAIFAALAARPTPAQMDGTAELFTCVAWGQQPRPAIPKPLRSLLIDHVKRTGTEPMKFRMRHGYGADDPAGAEREPGSG